MPPVIPIDRYRPSVRDTPTHEEILAAVHELMPDIADITLNSGQFNAYYDKARELARSRILQRWLENYAEARRTDPAA
jgi:hypothetical protein